MEIREEAIRALGKVANAGGDGGDGRRLETVVSRGKRVGGFKYVLFSPLFGEDSHFD